MDINTLPDHHYECIQEAASDYSLPTRLLLSIYATEGGKIGMINKNKNGTYDYGPFQINTVWLHDLNKRFGYTIHAHDLTYNFCFSARTASFILRHHINQADGNFWKGVGNYHSKTTSHHKRYVSKVYEISISF